MIETFSTLNNQEKLNDKVFKQVASDQGLDLSIVHSTGAIRKFVPNFMKVDLCDRPEQNACPSDDHYGQGGPSDGEILDFNRNKFGISSDSVFESSSCIIENKKNQLNRFFDLFGAGSS